MELKRLADWSLPESNLGRKLLLAGIILLAVFFRIHSLDKIPPALSHDEGFNGLEALELARTADPQIFYPENNGREGAQIYAGALMIWLAGSRPWTLRLASALTGVLTVPLLYVLGRDLAGNTRRQSRLIGLLAAFLLAVSFWHVLYSRFALRAVYLLPPAVLSVWLFWRGQRRPVYFIPAGAALGASLYTYLPARLMPLLFAGFALAALARAVWFPGGRRRAAWRQRGVWGGGVVLLIAFAVFLPLGSYFWQHPAAFWERAGQAWAAGQEDRSLFSFVWSGLAPTARMFFDRGDMAPWYNLAGRSALNAIGAAGFAAGVILALRRWRDPRSLLLLLWLVLMLAPTLLSESPPKFVRAIGAIPPVMVLAAAGLVWLGGRAKAKWPQTGRWGRAVVGLLLLVFTAGVTWRDYFWRWPAQPDVPLWFGVEEANLYEGWLARQETYDVVVPDSVYYYPGSRYLLLSRLPALTEWPEPAVKRPLLFLAVSGRCRARPGMRLIRTRPDGGGDVYAFAPADWPVTSGTLASDGSGWEDGRWQIGTLRQFWAADGAPGKPPLLAGMEGAVFGRDICLLAYELAQNPSFPGDVLPLTLYWENLRRFDPEYIVRLQLTAVNGTAAGDAAASLLGGGWLPGEVISTTHTLPIPPDAPPGKYRIRVEVSGEDAGRLDYATTWGEYLGDAAYAGNLTVLPVTAAPERYPENLDVSFADPALFRLTGYAMPDLAVFPGGFLDLNLYFAAARRMDKDYTLFVHLVDEAGNLYAQADSGPMGGRAPTSLWLPGERLPDSIRLPVDAHTPPGEYFLQIGAYYWADGQRLPLYAAGQRQPGDVYRLPVRIQVEDK